MIDLKELFPVDAIAPALGGAIIWFGANFAFIGPEVVGPRLQEKYYGPACEALVAVGRQQRASQERALRQQFEDGLENYAANTSNQARAAGGVFFSLFGADGAEFWGKWGNQIGGGLGTMADGALELKLNQERELFNSELARQSAEARKSIRFETASGYCDCAVSEALNERFDIAAYTASLRFYTPPTIRNIESGSSFSNAAACGNPPIL